jgi:hypothetical protein
LFENGIIVVCHRLHVRCLLWLAFRNNDETICSSEIDKLLDECDDDLCSETSSDCGWIGEAETADIRCETDLGLGPNSSDNVHYFYTNLFFFQ